MVGLFWNYFSVGMDAASAYRFHRLREARPWAASGRRVNQMWYTYFGFATGWMLGAPPIRDSVSLKARPAPGQTPWQPPLALQFPTRPKP